MLLERRNDGVQLSLRRRALAPGLENDKRKSHIGLLDAIDDVVAGDLHNIGDTLCLQGNFADLVHHSPGPLDRGRTGQFGNRQDVSLVFLRHETGR